MRWAAVPRLCRRSSCVRTSSSTRGVPTYPYLRISRSILLSSPNLRKSGSQDQKLSAIGERHPRPVNAFVAQPGAFEFRRIEVYNRFPDRRIEKLEIDFERQRGSLMKALHIVADEKSPDDKSPRLCLFPRRSGHTRSAGAAQNAPNHS